MSWRSCAWRRRAGRTSRSRDALALSVRTVERHLSNAYDKLGVSGKAARAAAVARVVAHAGTACRPRPDHGLKPRPTCTAPDSAVRLDPGLGSSPDGSHLPRSYLRAERAMRDARRKSMQPEIIRATEELYRANPDGARATPGRARPARRREGRAQRWRLHLALGPPAGAWRDRHGPDADPVPAGCARRLRRGLHPRHAGAAHWASPSTT